MTDFTTTQPILLTPAQLEKIEADGTTALAAIAAAGSGPPPVGVWQAMYCDISKFIANQLVGVPSAQAYWFSQAPFINSDNQNAPSGYFVRDVTAVGFGVASPSNPEVQAVSNAIGKAIYDGIVTPGQPTFGHLPAFWEQLDDDIYSALNGSSAIPNSPYPYPALPIPGWGGTFYYWNAPYDPNATAAPSTPSSTSISQYILGNSSANQTFIANYSSAIASTVIHFESTIPLISEIIPSILGVQEGIQNIWNSGFQGKLDVVSLMAQSVADYVAQGGLLPVTTFESALINFVQTQIGLYLGVGTAAITDANGSGVLVGGQGIGGAGNDTLTAGGGGDTFLINLPTSGSVTETIDDGTGIGQIVVATNGQFDTLGGSSANPLAPVSGQTDTWRDEGGAQYVFNPSNGQLDISGGALAPGDQVVINNFGLADAAGVNPYSGVAGGFAGIFLPPTGSVTAGAGVDVPAVFAAGSTEPYTLTVDTASNTAQTYTYTLSGANLADFDAVVGDQVVPLSAVGTFNVTLPAGQTEVSFDLADITSDNGQSDIASGATLQLTATQDIPDGSSEIAASITPLTITYTPQSPDTSKAPQPNSVITGQYNGGTGITTYNGDGSNDYIAVAGQNNLIQAANSGSDSIIGGSGNNTIYGGSGNDVISTTGTNDLISLGNGFNTVSGSASGDDSIYAHGGSAIINGNGGTDLVFVRQGNNEVYAGTQTGLSSAISNALAASATYQQGDLLSVLDGNDTIVGGNGNDLITAGSGDDVVVLGPGNDTFEGGVEVTDAESNWSAPVTQPNGSSPWLFNLDDIDSSYQSYTDPYAQPYYGTTNQVNGGPIGAANDTIYSSAGNDYINLGNGNNEVVAGPGNDSIFGGMGNDTITLGAGNDLVQYGGGNEFIAGGSGADTLAGGDGNNTIIGGSGNSTIYSAQGPSATWAGESQEQNYVDGGSGNDLIYGSGANDTLIGGTGNSTLYGGSGMEYLEGGSGNDALIAGSGNSTLVAGGSGADSLQGGSNASSSYLIYGGGGSDYIVGQSGTEILYAGDGGTAGAPTYVFASSSDATAQTTIYGGLGVDSLTGGVGNTVIYAGDGGTPDAPTSAYALSGATTIYGGLGTDQLQGGSGNDVLYAGDGGTAAAPDSVVAGAGASTLYGGAGASILQDLASGSDLIVSETGTDTLLGIGNDTLEAGSGNDFIQSNSGDPTIEINPGFGDSTVQSAGGNYNLVFGIGIGTADLAVTPVVDASGNLDLDFSGDGGNVLAVGALAGVLGTVSYLDPSTETVDQVLLSNGGDQTVAGGHGNLIVNATGSESVTGQQTDTISSFADSVTLSAGSVFSAGNSADIVGSSSGLVADVSGASTLINASRSPYVQLTASGTNDTLEGGLGYNKFLVANSTDVVDAASGAGTNILSVTASYTLPSNLSAMYLDGSGNLVGTGSATAATLQVDSGGNNTLVAGSGVDTLIDLGGNTTFVVNNAADVVEEYASGNNSIDSSVSFTLPGQVNTLTLTGSANLVGADNGGTDTLNSNTGVDTLVGSGVDTFVIRNSGDVIQYSGSSPATAVASVSYTLPTGVDGLDLTGSANLIGTANADNDTLISNSGLDTLVGGSGSELFIVNNAADVLRNVSAQDTIQIAGNYSLPSNVDTVIVLGSANVSVTGNAGADYIVGNVGSDTLVSGAGIDTLTGNSGSDTFIVNNADDTVGDYTDAAGNIVLASVSFSLPDGIDALTLTGSAGLTATANDYENDTLTSNNGLDTLVGGYGNDTFVVKQSNDVVIDYYDMTNVVQSGVTYTLPENVNTLLLTGSAAITAVGNDGADSLVGNLGADSLIAGVGTDTLVAGSGADTLIAGSGTDLFILNSASDVVSGSTFIDTVQSSASQTLNGTGGTLQLTGSANLMATAGSGNDTLQANSGNDTLRAGSGTTVLEAGVGIDTLIGGTGATTFVVNSSMDVLQNIAASGIDSLESAISYTLPTHIDVLTLLASGNLVGTGNADAHNTLIAGGANDTLIAGSATTTFIGSAEGANTFVVNSAADTVDAAAAATNAVISSVSYTAPTNVTALILSGSANLKATGNTSADELVGNAGADTLIAGVGNDTLVAGSGPATLIGGVGNQIFVINSASDLVQDTVTGNNNALISSISVTMPTNVSALTLSGSGNIVGTANGGNDSLTGGAGADTLIATTGNDTLVAGPAVTTLIGGSGNDTFVVNNTSDVVRDSSASATNALLSSANYTLATNVNELTLTGPASISGTGNAGNDLLVGGEGVDTLIAGSGTDTLVGGSGNTTFVIDSTADVVNDSSTTASNMILSSVRVLAPTNVNTIILTGSANLSAAANAANDTLVSNSGVDTMTGGAGNDTFVIANSADVLSDSATGANNIAEAAVNYALAANVNTLQLTGSGNLRGSANAGNDTLISNSGIDTLIGGAGNDLFIVNNAADVVQDSSSSASNTLETAVSYSLPTHVNTLLLTGTAALLATGNAGNDSIVANLGADTLLSGSGVDTLVGGGNTFFMLNNVGDVVQESAATATDTIESSFSVSTSGNVDMIVLTGSANLGATADAGADTLISNSGVDTLTAGSGPDVLVVNNSADVLNNLSAQDTVEASVSYTLPGNGATLTLIGSANITGTGNGGSDNLTAGSGNDTLVDAGGSVTMNGGAGNDTFLVSNPNDVIQDSYTTASNAVHASVSYSLPANVDSLLLTGSGTTGTGNSDVTNVLTAGAADETLVASAFASTLNGGTGPDLLFGNAVENVINGGTGQETIYAGGLSDVITLGNGGTAGTPVEVLGNASGTSSLTAETITGGSGYDLIYGGPGSNLIYGGAGTEPIYEGTGQNIVHVGAGGTSSTPDIVTYQSGATASSQSTVYGGTGVDVLMGGPGSDALHAGSGVATLESGSGANSLYGQSADLLLDYASGKSLLTAGGGAETLVGYGSDSLVAGSGADLLLDTASGAAAMTYEFGPGFGADTITTVIPSVFINQGVRNATLSFASGVEPSSLALSAVIEAGYLGVAANVALVINEGSGSIVVPGGLIPGAISSLNFADTGSESLDQLMNADGPGYQVSSVSGATSDLSTGNAQTVSNTNGASWIYAFGNTDSVSGGGATVYAYGNNDTVNVNYADVSGNDVIINASVIPGSDSTTLLGAADTVVAPGAPQGNSGTFVVGQSSDVIDLTSAGFDTVDALANYTLPFGVAELTLDSTVGSLAGASNAQGGLLVANAANDTLTGGAGADTLTASGSNDVLVGGSGTETYILNSSTDRIQFGTGTATSTTVETNFAYTLPTSADILEMLNATSGTGNTANDTLIGSGVSGGTLVSGSGNDLFVIQASGTHVQDSYTTTSDTIQSPFNYTLPTNVNTLVLSSIQGMPNNIQGIANSGNDSILANSGFDTLVAGSGNDTLVAGIGTDTFEINAGFGHDVIVNPQSGSLIQFGAGITQSSLTFTALPGSGNLAPSLGISGDGGSVTVQGGLIPGALSGVSFTGGATVTVPQLVAPSGRVTVTGGGGNLILSPNSSDSVTGGAGDDTIIGYGNLDTLKAGTGGAVIYAGGSSSQLTGSVATDILDALGSADTLIGGSGRESFVIGNTSDVVVASAGAVQNTLSSSVSYTLPANVNVLNLTGTASLIATGNAGADTITANAGYDTLVAGTGLATLIGGTGTDFFVVNNQNDVVRASNASANDQIQSTVSYSLPANSPVNFLVLTGTGSIVGTGNSQSDSLVALSNFDTLVAGSGNTTLTNNHGGGVLIGGSGADTFLSAGNNEIITGSGVDIVSGSNGDAIVVNNSSDAISIGADGILQTNVNFTSAAAAGLGNPFTWQLMGSANLSATETNPQADLVFYANSGNDSIVSDAGATTFNGGTGVDTFVGGLQSQFNLTNPQDVVVAQPGSVDTYVVNFSYTLPTNAAIFNLLVSQGDGRTEVGNSGNDTLTNGTGIDDIFIAGSGNDSLAASGANNTLVAGAGNDTLSTSDPTDVIVLNSGFGTVQVSDSTQLPGNAGTIDFGPGIAAISLTAKVILDVNGNAALSLSDAA